MRSLLVHLIAFAVAAIQIPMIYATPLSSMKGGELEVRVMDARSPIPTSDDLIPITNDISIHTSEVARAVSPTAIGMAVGVVAALGGLAVATCSQEGVPAAVVCIASAFGAVVTGLALVWAALLSRDEVQAHFAARNMTALHTGPLVKDTKLLLAEHDCFGPDCHQLYFYHNSTNDFKTLSVQPKMVAKRQGGDSTDGDPDSAGLFMDYIWTTENESEEVSIGQTGAAAMDQAAINAFQNPTFAQNGFYCAGFFVSAEGFANKGAVFQNQGADFPFQPGMSESIVGSCAE